MSLGRLLDLREGEGRVALVLFGHLFFITAAAIVLSAAKNGLFLSAYPADLIPHVIVAASITTAVFAVVFSALTGRYERLRVVEVSAVATALSLAGARALFLANPAWAFAIYLWLSIVGALVVALAWGSVGDLLTGRQSRRLMTLLIAGTSVAGMAAGFGIAPAVAALGTPNLLLAAGLALVLGAALLRLAPWGTVQPSPRARSELGFVGRVFRGATLIRRHRLIALLAAGLVLSALIGTLVDYQFKALLQREYDRDAITSLFGVLAGAVGLGTLLMQAAASRLLFRRWGLVAGPYAQAAMVGAAALSVAATGWLAALAVLRFVDETTRFTVQKTVEQVSMAPFPAEVRHSAFTLLGGVLKPLATAATGLVLMFVAPLVGLRGLAVLTAVSAVGLYALFRRHPALYRDALEEALARQTLDLRDDWAGVVSVLDRNALEIIDRTIERDDPALTLFAISLLRHAGPGEALPRLRSLIRHEVPEVRAEAAVAVVAMTREAEQAEVLAEVRELLRTDSSPVVLLALLQATDALGVELRSDLILRHMSHDDPEIRREALLALARHEARNGGDRTPLVVYDMLESDAVADRVAALEAVALLRDPAFLGVAFQAANDGRTRTAAVATFTAFGDDGWPWVERLLTRPGIDESELTGIAAQLAEAGYGRGLDRLLGLSRRKETARAVLPALQRARRMGSMAAVATADGRAIIQPLLMEGARYGLLARDVRRQTRDGAARLLVDELELRQRRAAETALAGLALSYEPDQVDRIAPHLRSRDAAAKSNAMELLETLLDGEDRVVLVPFFEGFDAPDRLEDAARELGVPVERIRRDALAALEADTDPWLRSCAAFVAGRVRAFAGVAGAPTQPTRDTEEFPMLPLMEIVFFLKSSPLFRPLSGEELAQVARLATTVHVEEGEVLLKEGDPGDAFYMVVSGRLAVEAGTRQVNTLGPHEGVGEMALLDGEPRSATIRALEPCTLLRIDQASFEALVDRTPALSKAIYKSLSGRLRGLLKQVHD